MESIAELRARALPAIRDHWARCREAGLPHDPSNLAAVVRAFERFFSVMETIPAPRGDRARALEAIAALYADLDAINETVDGGLLETDERELLVPFVIDATRATGLDPADFPDGEPGGEHRNF